MAANRRVAIVTGASRGIGQAVAQRMADDGLAVVVNYLRNEARAAEIVREIERQGGESMAIRADVSQAQDRRQLLDKTIERWGRLDVLVNNAGITSPGRRDLLDLTEADWDVVFDTNLKGPFFLAQQAAHIMIGLVEQGVIDRPKIINITSISAYAISTNRADYCMAKAALRMMTGLFADRLAFRDIGLFEICPGIIRTDMTAPVEEKYDQAICAGLTPIRRWGEPADVATAISAVVADLFPFSTGECINVDGGFHLRRLP